jgi:sn-glycerol 3-phosphate transport system substrate-binding protein
MLAAGPAVKQVWQLSQETGVEVRPARPISAASRGYYSLSDGRLASLPFNSSIFRHVVQQGRLRKGRA